MIQLIIILCLIGVALYLINLIPMDATIKKVINILVIVLVILWILQMLFPSIMTVPLHPIR